MSRHVTTFSEKMKIADLIKLHVVVVEGKPLSYKPGVNDQRIAEIYNAARVNGAPPITYHNVRYIRNEMYSGRFETRATGGRGSGILRDRLAALEKRVEQLEAIVTKP